MRPTVLALLLALTLALRLQGCGGTGSDSTAGGGAASPTEGTVLVQHLLTPSLRSEGSGIPAVPAAATTFVCAGFDDNHQRRYGPVRFARAAVTLLTGVPDTVRRIRVHYLDAAGNILLTAHVPVTVQPGSQTSVVAANLQAPWAAEASKARPAYGSLSSPWRTPASAGDTSSGLTVQIANDSGQDVYLLLAGAGISVSTTSSQLATSSAGSGTVTATELTDLPLASPSTITSTYTGNTLDLYEFTLNTVSSGELLVSFANPVHSTDGGIPSAGDTTDADFPTRWDHLEITYPGQVDLTSINAYGIPMQVDFLDDTTGDTLSTLTYYASTDTILNALYNLDNTTMGGAFYDTSGTSGFQSQWVAPTPDLGTFARVLGPSGLLTPSQQDPAPYPSFGGYLAALEQAGTTFTVTGSSGAGANARPAEYTYTGAVASDGNGGYTVVLTGTMEVTPTSVWGAPTGKNAAGDSAALPTDCAVTLNLGSSVFDYNIYAVPADAFTVTLPADVVQSGTLATGSQTVSLSASTPGLLPGMSVTGTGVPAGTTLIEPISASSVTLSAAVTAPGTVSLTFGYAPLQDYIANSTYADIAGDFFAALNNGYLAGNWGDGSKYADGSATTAGQSPWYFNPPTPYPFGAARPSNDGFYNPYAAVFYNLSDAYAFVYGDRNGRPSPALEVPPDVTMRITILHDDRLDMPQVTATPASDTEIDLSWQAVTGATGYSISYNPPYGGTPLTTTDTSKKLTGLVAGQPYQIQVKATATATPTPMASPVPIESYALPVMATTQGTFTPPTLPATPTPMQLQIACGGWSGGAYPLSLPTAWTWTINGTSQSPSPGSPGQANTSVSGVDGANYYPMVVKDTAENLVYQGVYAVWLTGKSTSYNIPNLTLTGLLNALTLAGGAGTPPYSNTAGSQAVIGTPVDIQPDKRFSPVVFPSPSPSPSPGP